jgi:hypothetical protein
MKFKKILNLYNKIFHKRMRFINKNIYEIYGVQMYIVIEYK